MSTKLQHMSGNINFSKICCINISIFSVVVQSCDSLNCSCTKKTKTTLLALILDGTLALLEKNLKVSEV